MVIGRDALGRTNSQTYHQGGGQTPGSNIIPNASVEQVSGSDPDKPEGWQHSAWGTNTANFTYLNEGYTGSRSVKTEITNYTDGDAKWYFDPVSVVGNTSYTFKDYYRSNIQTEAVVQYTHQNQSVTYEWLGNINTSSNWTQSTQSFTTPATAVQATVFHIVAGVGWLMVDDAELYVSSQTGSQNIIASDSVTRSQSGRVISGTENGQTKSYTYDKAGRLTNATIGSNTYAYGFGAQNGSCASATNTNSGKNSNRTTQTINGQTTTYCYDYADKLISSSDPLANAAQYDSHGNTTSIGSGTSPLQMFYDSSDRNWGFQQTTSAGNGNASYYSRDVANRITYRETDTISAWNWALTNQQWYGFIGSGDAASLVRNANWDITEKYLSLAGGVLVTIRPGQTGNANKVYSLPNMHGSVMATTDAAGTLTGTFRYDPFGNKVSTSFPDNTYAGATLGYAGAHQKITEKDLSLAPIQMGARVYLSVLGRFTQVDPIPGGNANDYIYPPDPINMFDFSGASESSIPLFNNQCILCGSGSTAVLNRAVAAAIGMTLPVPYRAPARAAALRAVAPAAKPALGLAKVYSSPVKVLSNGPPNPPRSDQRPRGGKSAMQHIGGAARAAGVGCVASSGGVFITGAALTIFTWGAAAPASGVAIVGACVKGAVGGVVVYGLTQGSEGGSIDASGIYDGYDLRYR
ncbi:MAG TPA: RHS repeat-associated core domain-containing protein [Verrucomicrobiae bacterium]|nr:RHS repeat-associated core domain-containing protein [Verrucomicrobiae bacterium]